MNELFVNVKVDREERPDVDAIYMDAVQALTGRGGWPMTVFMTPDGRAVLRRHLLPRSPVPGADDRRRRRLAQPARRARAERQRARRGDRHERRDPNPADDVPGATDLNSGAAAAGRAVRRRVGWVRPGAEVPVDVPPRARAAGLHDRRPPRPRETIVTTTLDAMASGGMYDHIGGGFARYSVDRQWLVPHFEKMLYDQALLVRDVPARPHRRRQDPLAPGRSARRSLRPPATSATPTAASTRPRTPTRPTSTGTAQRGCSTRGRPTRPVRRWRIVPRRRPDVGTRLVRHHAPTATSRAARSRTG